MRVLITGGYGFIGSHVAERFSREGYDVFIIDNLSTGKKENVSIKHKGYILAIEDPKCEEIFKSYKFDIVVHLAAQSSVSQSMANPQGDLNANAVGLVNMLELSNKYNIKKFIFASSAAVYGDNTHLPINEIEPCEPISPYGISKWIGEEYCLKWKELYDLETLVFRFSNVYGPRQNGAGEGGVISVFMNQLINRESITVYGDGNQTRDFIYVEDIVEAIFRSSYSELSGIYNVSTNSKTSINDLVGQMNTLFSEVPVKHQPAKQGDIYSSVLDNQKLKNDLDWSPIVSVEQGLEETYHWFKAESERKKIQEGKESRKFVIPSFVQKMKPYVENIIAFLLVAWLISSDSINVLNSIDLSIFYIMIFGVIYGNRQAILSVGLSVFLLIQNKLSNGMEFVSLLYDTTFFFQVALFLFVGLVVGYSTQRKNNMLTEQRDKLEEMESRYTFLNDLYAEIRDVKDELQLRVLNSGDSFGKIHSIIKELDDLEPEKILTRTVSVIQNILNSKKVSIYVFNGYQTFLRLKATSNYSDDSVVNSIKVADSQYVQYILNEEKLYVNRNLDVNAPLMAAPIYFNNKITAVITIEDLAFDKFSLYHENLFKVMCELVESALGRALSYIEATETRRYIPNTPILKGNVFKEILESKKEALSKYNTPYQLLRGSFGQESIEDYSNRISGLLRETDYIGQLEDQDLLILLSNTSNEDIKVVLNRFNNAGIQLQVEGGEI